MRLASARYEGSVIRALPLYIFCPLLLLSSTCHLVLRMQVGRDPTFDSMALRSPCVNRGEFGRAARDLGLIGKLLTRGDVDMLFSELVR